MKLEYFTAPWCAPCRVFGPIVEEVTHRLGADIEKIDVDKNPERLPADVRGVPTIIMYNDGKEVSRIVGARGPEDFEGWIKSGGI